MARSNKTGKLKPGKQIADLAFQTVKNNARKDIDYRNYLLEKGIDIVPGKNGTDRRIEDLDIRLLAVEKILDHHTLRGDICPHTGR